MNEFIYHFKRSSIALLLLFLTIDTFPAVQHNSHITVSAQSDEETTPKTGSFQNCTQSYESLSVARKALLSTEDIHPDSDLVTISCDNIHYRVPGKSIGTIQARSRLSNREPIIIGVLSGASGEGLSKRNSIRSTWAYRKENVFFIVAGPWEDIEHEYDEFGDLLWIDKEEIYITETSVLTFKTESFVAVMYNKFMKDSEYPASYLFKADDDSYVDMQKLYRALLEEPKKRNYQLDYWGKCNEGGWKPHRDKSNKWFISYESKYLVYYTFNY